MERVGKARTGEDWQEASGVDSRGEVRTGREWSGVAGRTKPPAR